MALVFGDDATPAYRGYRLQALYTLHRILKSNGQREYYFQPEGKEDLSVYDGDNNLLEVVQVKAYSGSLTLSDFSIEKPSSFFYRAASYMPDIQIKLVIFGTPGPELKNALTVSGKHRNDVVKKLVGTGIDKLTEAAALQLIEKITLEQVSENKLTEEVFELLRNSSIGYNPEVAFDTLNFWLYRCSENKTIISPNSLLDKFNNVGKYLAYLSAQQTEWFTTIVPIGSDLPQSVSQISLEEEFHQGVSARYEHINAALDVLRPQKMNALDEEFLKSNVVILHGASGQGKTVLAYRYLHERFPQQWRFQIRTIESKKHAYTLVAALLAQVEAVDLPVAIFIDVAPSNVDWPELVSQLSRHKNIKILVSIREEDYNRASTNIGSEFKFGHVELSLDSTEAKQIYQRIIAKQFLPKFTSFEEAWIKFGGNGPLLEFIYLLTTGASLRERLKQQVNWLQDEARSGKADGGKELKLLTLVSVASAFSAKLKVLPTVAFLELTTPHRTFELLEKEYLLRRNSDGSFVDGLHPVRSSILVELLLDPVFSPWAAKAVECLPLIEEAGLETFLLHSFLYHEDESGQLLDFLNTYQPVNWAAIGGICRALLWLGVYKYTLNCRDLYQEVYNFSGSGGLFLLDFDITNVVPDGTAPIHSLMDSLIPSGPKHEQHLDMTRNRRKRQPHKNQVFNFVTTWLLGRSDPPQQPATAKEWDSLSYTFYWLGFLNLEWPIESWVPLINSQTALDDLPTEVLGNVVLGLSSSMGELFQVWLARHRTWILSKFEKATGTAVVEDDGEKITAHFGINWELLAKSLFPEPTESVNQPSSLHPITLETIQLLRHLLPDRQYYACQGYGHNFSANFLVYDDTRKTGIRKENLPSGWSVEINAVFRGLMENSLRPNGWLDYCEEVLALRHLVIKTLRQLETGLLNYFRQPKLLKVIGKGVNSEDWDTCQYRLKVAPLLPLTISDPWGFTDEFSANLNDSSDTVTAGNVGLVSQIYRNYHKAFSNWGSNLLIFYTQAAQVMALNPLLAKQAKNETQRSELLQKAKTQGFEPKFANLSVYNLAEAIKSLSIFQLEFKNLLSSFTLEQTLTALETQERELFSRVWNLWYIFAFTLDKKITGIEFNGPTLLSTALNKLRNNLTKELRELNKENPVQITILSENVKWQGETALWLAIDGVNATEVYNTLGETFLATRRAILRFTDEKLRKTVLTLYWSRIVVIPLVQGKLLFNKVPHLTSLILLENENSTNDISLDQSLPKSTLDSLQIHLWNEADLNIGYKFWQICRTFLALAGHFRDLTRLPDTRDQITIKLNNYIIVISSNWNSQANGLQAAVNELREVIYRSQHFTELEQAEQLNFLTALDHVVEGMLATFTVQNLMNLPTDQISQLVNELESFCITSFNFYLQWATKILG